MKSFYTESEAGGIEKEESSMTISADIAAIAKRYGASVDVKPNGHFQLRGDLLVNYYPLSKTRTAYVAGTTKGVKHCTPENAVKLCFSAPQEVGKDSMDKRKRNTRKRRQKLLNRGVTRCHWCGCELTLDTSTLEHIIPLKRGGLDNDNNTTLACESCNQKRGHDMPELRDEA